MKTYEGMFLFDPTVTNEWDNIEAEVMRLMERIEAEVIVCAKWDDRRLAYEIRGRKRGVYVLVFFKADPSKVGDLERDVQLSEQVMRCLVQKVDHITEDEMREIAARPADHSAVEADRITGRWSAVEASAPVASRSSSGGEASADTKPEDESDRPSKGRTTRKADDDNGVEE